MKSTFLLLLFISFSFISLSQVAVNTTGESPDPSAILDIKSSNKGVLVPRLGTTQRIEISSAANGLLVFDVDTDSFWFYNSGSWNEMLSGPNISVSQIEVDSIIIPNYPSFAADLNTVQNYTQPFAFYEVGNWKTFDAAIPYLHDNGNNFDELSGTFLAPYDGFYSFSAQIRFDGVETAFYRLLFAVNGLTSLDNGFHAIGKGASASTFNTLSLSGVMKLNKGDEVSVVVTTNGDDNYNIHSESGFNGHLVARF